MKKKNLLKEILDDREDISNINRTLDALKVDRNNAIECNRRVTILETAHKCQATTNDDIFDKIRAPNIQSHTKTFGVMARLSALEKYQSQVNASENIVRICERLNALDGSTRYIKTDLKEDRQRICELEESYAVFLKSIPDIEILKSQMKGLQTLLSMAKDTIAELQMSAMEHDINKPQINFKQGQYYKEG